MIRYIMHIKKTYTLFIIIGLLIILSTIIYCNNYSITLLRAGISKNNVKIIKAGIDANDNEYQILLSNNNYDDYSFFHLIRNNMGIWRVTHKESSRHPVTGLLNYGGIKICGIKRFSVNDDPIFISESFQLFHGNNAIKLIEFLPGQLPYNTAVNIWQAGKEYTISLIHYGDANNFNIDMYKLLMDARCIDN